MICCGKERNTRFCPDCGGPLNQDSDLYRLLAHLRARQKDKESGLITTKAAEAQWTNKESYQRRLNLRQRLVDKWKGWADALEALLKEQEAK